MKVIGLTGGIGSGKTTVANMFKSLGVPIYIADDEARKLSNTSKVIRRKLIKLLGESAYMDGVLNSKFISNLIFSDPILLKKVNEIIHPRVGRHFKKWLKKQTTPYCIMETAILFENDGYKSCDLTILITCPKAIRIKRVLARDKTTMRAILNRIENQWTDERKAEIADIIIENIDINSTQRQVLELHKSFI